MTIDKTSKSRFRRWLGNSIAWGLLLGIALGTIGQVVRDRSVILGLFMYLPLVLIGLAAIGWDAIRRGRAIPGPRFLLAALGLVAAIGASVPMVGFGPTADDRPGREISILQWNVVWGGGKLRNPPKWAAIRAEIVAKGADVIVLNEPPPDDWLAELVRDLGPDARSVQVGIENGKAYWDKRAVIAKGPLRIARQESIPNGSAAVIEAEVRGQVLRMLVVDAKSNPFLSRTPMLMGLADIVRRSKASGEPIDLLAGDFNSMSRSVGFDAIEAQGFDLASRSSLGWRGTFPSGLPIYDIDHVWVRREFPGLRDDFFTNLASDHRGQVVRFRVP